MKPRRARQLPEDCPRCAKPLMIVEEGATVEELAEPVKWVPVRRYCSGGCLLTVDDFPDEVRGPED